MRILFSSSLISAVLLCLALPSAALNAHDADVGLLGNHSTVSGGSTETTAVEWPYLLSPSHIVEGIQNAYLPTAFRFMSAVQAFTAPKPSSSDFWDTAKQYEQILQDYVPRLLQCAEEWFKSTAFTDITYAMKDIVHATTAFRISIQDALAARDITLDTLTRELELICVAIVHELENVPPPSSAPSHAERDVMVNKVMDVTEMALVDIATEYGIEEQVVVAYLDVLRPRVHALTVAVGDINEQYPQLLPALAFSVAGLLIPEIWILRPLLSVFGFGPAGPVKGSAAAWIQRRFWGATVSPRSWFSWLQAAGMGKIPKWGGFPGAPIFAGGLSVLLLPCLFFCCCLLTCC